MNRYGIIVCQNLYKDRFGEIHNEYHFGTENGFYLGYLRFPSDGQYAFDAEALNEFMKGLAIRFGYIKPKQRCK